MFTGVVRFVTHLAPAGILTFMDAMRVETRGPLPLPGLFSSEEERGFFLLKNGMGIYQREGEVRSLERRQPKDLVERR